ncbi:hypothetical protein GR183_14435 [Stappia sp. GBMRC 2046]|uniref:Thiol:disulfide interchange protein DsbD N-terminal domain-containing protein n=1 Tax=Stappia sediminis TaxID=2692190 RepID=A0A7X3LVX3_9HYPH|nr:protein-disulfide reductase DsbD domain-containing protein [Stappia sediminis]MXN66109.1 hypothetical protein [Stappia sediminis]
MKNLLAALLVSLALGAPVHAASTDWVEVMGGKVRLIAGGALEEPGHYDAGLEFRMEPGWHIYWRFPGEAGVPTQADFSASTNLGEARLRFPAPVRYDDGYATSIVYRDQVILPIEVIARETAAPLELAAGLFFGICREICVPAQMDLSLNLASDWEVDFPMRLAISRATLSLPRPQGNSAPRVVSIENAGSAENDKAGVLKIHVEVDETGGEIDLFAEGAEGSFIEVPRLQSRDGNRATFELSTNGLVKKDGVAPLTLVLRDGDQAVEHSTEIRFPVSN